VATAGAAEQSPEEAEANMTTCNIKSCTWTQGQSFRAVPKEKTAEDGHPCICSFYASGQTHQWT